MKRKMNKFYLLVLFLLPVLAVNGQTEFFLDNNSSSLIVEGTSSIHDWEMEANDLKSTIVLRFNDNELLDIEKVEFSSPAENVLSDNSLMNSKSHKALKAGKYAEITFHLKSVNRLNVSGKSVSGQIVGVVRIAGVSKTIQVNFSGKINPGHLFSISGSVPLKLADFDIDPPTAMLGALKTGDNIKINFKFLYKKKQ
ncbi:MAG TPA: YceI family protein [Bacteroidales bacterium]|nr:YceI family protein [Bacteroidales bacterium]